MSSSRKKLAQPQRPAQSADRTLQLTYSAAQAAMFFDDEALGRFRFYPKGRRLGATRGGANACIEWCTEGMAVLWGDTTHANIGRYVDRYFKPTLRRAERDLGLQWAWNSQKGLLLIGDQGGYVDFRSADRPENWEGFGYHRVFLNEAGIILDDRYLYDNAVLPMLMDHPGSQLIAAGTPKLRQGKGRLFAELVQRARANEPGYYARTLTSYDNPFLQRSVIDELARSLPPGERRQEIFGEFVEPEGTLMKREWLRIGSPFPRWRQSQCVIALGVDLAISTRATADYTAVVVVARDPDGVTWVLDVARRRLPFHQVLRFIADMAAKWNADVVAVEEVQFQAAVVQELLRTTEWNVRGVRPDKDKVARFRPVEVRYEQGLIYHAADLPPEFTDELLAFPAPPPDHDDMVDALGLAFMASARTDLGQTIDATGDRIATAAAAVNHDEDGWGSVSVTHHRGF